MAELTWVPPVAQMAKNPNTLHSAKKNTVVRALEREAERRAALPSGGRKHSLDKTDPGLPREDETLEIKAAEV